MLNNFYIRQNHLTQWCITLLYAYYVVLIHWTCFFLFIMINGTISLAYPAHFDFISIEFSQFKCINLPLTTHEVLPASSDSAESGWA